MKAYINTPEGKGTSLDRLYQMFVVDKAFETQAQMEARIKKEVEDGIAKRAAAGQAMPAPGGVVAATGTQGRGTPTSLEDIVRKSIAGLA